MEKQYKVKVTVRAEQSLREISHYIAVDLMEPQTAVKLLRTLQKAINSLDMFPHRVHLTPEEPWHSLGIHRLVSKNYYRSKISRNYWLFEPKCRNNAEITYTQRLQIASYFP